jgi:predicted dithiol-disulfide oxidoreductase (DUF899 family)
MSETIGTREEWLAARLELLEAEKAAVFFGARPGGLSPGGN